jgi:hypothetical protein
MEIVPAAPPPRILQIVREPFKPGREAAYSAIEEETAQIAAALGCPHPYLGSLSVSGSAEAWWFNGYESEAEPAHVADAYAKNTQLMAALQQSGKRKSSLTLAPIDVFARYRPELSVGIPWLPGLGRFLVITVTRADPRSATRSRATVFETEDGVRFVVTPAQTREAADAAHALAGPESYVLAVRPSWSFPATEWIAADPEFWRSSARR